MMKSIVCPVSDERINEKIVRITALFMATLAVSYLFTDMLFFLALLFIDFFIRGVTTLPYSPFSALATGIGKSVNVSYSPIDKAPKVFAARVGLLFSTLALLFHVVNPAVGTVLMAILFIFAVLEAAFNICAGCLVYTYVIKPYFE